MLRMDRSAKPRLRPLEAIESEVDGQPAVILRDPEGISEHTAALSPALAHYLFLALDGTRTVESIEADLARATGQRADASGLIAQLDEALFLETPRYYARRAAVLAAYRRERLRPPAMTDSYPADLEGFLDGLYTGRKPSRARTPLAALAIPHLDLRFGGRTAAAALHGLSNRFVGDTVVVLGVGHNLLRFPYAMTRKDFGTPLGTVPLAEDLYDRVLGKAGSWLLEEEYAHAGEHSVEFAALLLRHALPGREFRILPVLCGSFGPLLEEGKEPREDPLVGAFLETLAEEAPGALLVASVDLAHLGPRYGDAAPLAEADLARTREEDVRMLDLLADRDAEGFFSCLAGSQDRRRVCGLSALYSLAALLPKGRRGRLLAYEQTVFPEEGNTVTICAMNWTR